MSSLRVPDYRYLGAIGALLVFGLIMLSSASSVVGLTQFNDTYYFVKRQLLLGLLPGLALGYFVYRAPYRLWQKVAAIGFAASIVLLILVFVPGFGLSYNTFAHRWINIAGINFQPSEITKLAFIVFLAAWLSKHARTLTDFKQGFLPFLIITGIPMGLIILQPDLGTASVIALIAGVMFFVAGGRLKHLAALFGVGVAALGVLVLLEPYRLERLTIFLHPELDPQGIGYQINQAFLAIGSGGWWGRGFGHSRAKFQYLPEVTGDSIFAVIGEEMGFFISAALIILVAYIFLRGLQIAKNAPDDFGRLLAAGIAAWFAGQAMVNISAMIGLLPLTGIPFPFVSYGGTALAIALVGVAMMANISSKTSE